MMRAGTRGATLIEALIAIAALGIGTAGVMQLITTITETNRRAAFQNLSLDVAAELRTQIQDAHCDVVPGPPAATEILDPGLSVGAHDAPSGAITLAGELATVPPIRVSYQVTREANPSPTFDGPPAFDVEVTIREITREAAKDDPAVRVGYWIRTFFVKKVCNFRLERVGRGEFY